MEKSDLKTGMKVVTREDASYLVVLDTTSGSGLANYKQKTYIPLNDVGEDLTSRWNKDKDIVEVWDSEDIASILDSTRDWKKIWSRPSEIKELTMAEVEEKFGCKCKIIK